MAKIINKYSEYTKSLNKDYDWNPIPDSDVVNTKSNANIKEIGIGEADPVLKFRDWIGQYWLKKQDVAKIRKNNKKK